MSGFGRHWRARKGALIRVKYALDGVILACYCTRFLGSKMVKKVLDGGDFPSVKSAKKMQKTDHI